MILLRSVLVIYNNLASSYIQTKSIFVCGVGEHDTRSNNAYQEDITPSKIISHPSYNKKNHDSDIALIKLSRSAKIGTYVNTVCLPGQGQHVPVGTSCYIVGKSLTPLS